MHPAAARLLQDELVYIDECVAQGLPVGIDQHEATRRRKLAHQRAWEYSDDLHRHPPTHPHATMDLA